MFKKQRFILIAILALIMFFSVSAVCNLCGLNLAGTGQSGSSSESKEGGQDDTTSASQGSASETSAEVTEETEQEETEQAENHDPVIVKVIADDVELDLAGELRTLVNTGIKFQVQARDEDGDEMSYFVSDSNGNNMETVKLDNDNAAFGWVSPGEMGLHEIYIKVTDGNGGECNATVKVTANVMAHAFEGEDAEEPAVSVFETGPYTSLCGSVTSRSVLWGSLPQCITGDSGDNEQIKAYLSFDISSLLGLSGLEVVSATLDLGNLARINDPGFADRLDIKAIQYGELGTEDFAVGGTALISCSTGLGQFSFSNDALKNTLQQVINEDSSYYQVKFGLNSATDSDDVADCLGINYPEAKLTITYTAD